MKKLMIMMAAAIFLAGCTAKDVELRVSTDDLQDAIAGEDTSIRFIARFESFGAIDEEKRAQLDGIQAIVEGSLEIEDYNLVNADTKTTITVEGEIPVRLGEPGSGEEPFALYVWPIDNPLLPGFTHAMQLDTGGTFEALQARMREVSYMLAINDVQPVTYRLRAETGSPLPILAGGGQIDGNSFAVRALSIDDGDRLNITFSGGAYENVFGGLLLALP